MSRTLHSILHGLWAMHPQGAQAWQPQVLGMLRGEQVKLSKEQVRLMRAPHEPRMDDGTGIVNPNDAVPDTQKKVLILPLKGAIIKEGDWCTYGMSDYCNWLNRAERDSSIVGVVFDVDSPGGEAYGMTMLVDQIQRMKKPVVSIVRSGMAASAAYGIVSATREVYANQKSDLFGSIGSYLTLANWNKYMQAEGLDLHEIYATLSTDKNAAFLEALKADPNDPNDPHYARIRKEFIDPFNEQFLATVKAGRPQLKKNQELWGTGRTVFADEAISIGLIDGYNTLEGCVERVRELAGANAQPGNSAPKNHENMSLKSTLKSIGAAITSVFPNGEAVTSESLAALNAQLREDGIENLAVVTSEQAGLVSGYATQVEAAQSAQRTAEAQVTEANTARDAAQGGLALRERGISEASTLLTSAMTELGIEAVEGEPRLTTVLNTLRARTTDLATATARITELENTDTTEGLAAGVVNEEGDKTASDDIPDEVRAFHAENEKILAGLKRR